jgi:phospholipase/carboxylesterase
MRREHRIGATWYVYDGDQERFRRELDRTERLLLDLMRHVETEHGLRPRRRILLGFSQGGYCGSFIALRHPDLFQGLVVCSARVKTEILHDEMGAAAAHGFRVLLVHGLRDTAVLPESAESSRDGLAASGIDVELEMFDTGHGLGRHQVAAIAAWLRRF